MEEKQLELLFKQFLILKGYPSGSLLSQVALRTTGEGVFRPDLVIIDINNKEYVAIVEFKTNINDRVKINVLGQFYKYFSLLGTQSIPGYLVFSISDEDFQILSLTKDNTFQPISKDEFPLFETLSAKKITDEKIAQRELEEKTFFEIQEKKRKNRLSAYLSLVSLLLGVLASLYSIYSFQKGLSNNYSDTKLTCCDSLQSREEEINRKIRLLESRLASSTNTVVNSDTSKIDALKLSLLDNRIKIIESGISSDPEKALSILAVRRDIELLKKADEYIKELNQSKLDALKDEINIHGAWMLGVLIAIFGTLLSFIVPNLLPRKSE